MVALARGAAAVTEHACCTRCRVVVRTGCLVHLEVPAQHTDKRVCACISGVHRKHVAARCLPTARPACSCAGVCLVEPCAVLCLARSHPCCHPPSMRSCGGKALDSTHGVQSRKPAQCPIISQTNIQHLNACTHTLAAQETVPLQQQVAQTSQHQHA